jgi:hypothetical protein
MTGTLRRRYDARTPRILVRRTHSRLVPGRRQLHVRGHQPRVVIEVAASRDLTARTRERTGADPNENADPNGNTVSRI